MINKAICNLLCFWLQSDLEASDNLPMSAPSAIGVSLASAGLMFGVAATSSNEESLKVWTTGLSGKNRNWVNA